MNKEGGVKEEVIRKINLLSACASLLSRPLPLVLHICLPKLTQLPTIMERI